MEDLNQAKRIVQDMYDNDAFSQWLGIEIITVELGACILEMDIRKEMANGFDITHGGIAYSLADSALAFASNSHGVKAVSIETSISHHEAVRAGDRLTATAEEVKLANRIAWYEVEVINQENALVASFKGTVYRTFVEWDI